MLTRGGRHPDSRNLALCRHKLGLEMLHILAGLSADGAARMIDLGAGAYSSQSSGRLWRWWGRVDVIRMDLIQAKMIKG
jgi:hypothetical protein